jgi:hypothetical protein
MKDEAFQGFCPGHLALALSLERDEIEAVGCAVAEASWQGQG